ncbi:unnamed protein product [Paramecium sonneborni]|nr:unnamed protein product [Paramecium sonneborni]
MEKKVFIYSQSSISNELKELYSKGSTYIKVYMTNTQDHLFNQKLIIIMKGKIETLNEADNYSFILKFPENFPSFALLNTDHQFHFSILYMSKYEIMCIKIQ